MLVNIGDSKSEQKSEITGQVIGEKLSPISGIESENILSFKIEDESVQVVVKIRAINKSKILEAKYSMSVTGWTIDVDDFVSFTTPFISRVKVLNHYYSKQYHTPIFLWHSLKDCPEFFKNAKML